MTGSEASAVAGRFVLLLVAAMLILGCVPARGEWDSRALTVRYPELAETRHRLRDLAPHFVHRKGELILFLCRWRTADPIPVLLPPDASESELAMLRTALDAWADSGLGVRFVEVDAGRDTLTIRFKAEGDPGPLPVGAGDTLADCRVYDSEPVEGQIRAALKSASIHLRRDQPDLVGRAVALSDDERLGAALHEIGHALGFSSHVRAGRSILSSNLEIARQLGAALRRGERVTDPSLSALYKVPSGTTVGRLALSEAASAMATRFDRAARAAELTGPYTRVGDQGARYFYENARGVSAALSVRPWPVPPSARDPIVLIPNAPALWLLERMQN